MKGLWLSLAAMSLILITVETAHGQQLTNRVNYRTYYSAPESPGVLIIGSAPTGAFGNPVHRFPSTVITIRPVRVTPISNYQTPVYFAPPVYYGQPNVGNGHDPRTHQRR